MTQHSEISTTVAMLVSLFGNPYHADPEANAYEWRIELDDGSLAIVRNLNKGGSAGRIQDWSIACESEQSINKLKAKLEEGENYYEGSLHPELFITRTK